MTMCFNNNIYLCFLPAHTLYGLQPLDKGIFNAVKATYRKELSSLASLTDVASMDKINFLRCYSKAREAGMTERNIKSGFRTIGNWPISRQKALNHLEIQRDKEMTPKLKALESVLETPKNSRQIIDMAKATTPRSRLTYCKITKAFEI